MTNTETARAALLARLPITLTDMRNVSSKRSDHIRGLRNILTGAQGNVCAGCGLSLTGARTELCHIGTAPQGYGIAPAAVYVGCKECNDYDREVCGGDAARIIAAMVAPELVQTTHPNRAACLAASGNDRAALVRAARG